MSLVGRLRFNSDADGRGNKVPEPGDFSEVQKTAF